MVVFSNFGLRRGDLARFLSALAGHGGELSDQRDRRCLERNPARVADEDEQALEELLETVVETAKQSAPAYRRGETKTR